jgi:toxin ParE1/3/4
MNEEKSFEIWWSAPALRHLLEIVRYISIDSRAAARRMRDEIKTKASRLERFPYSGRVVPELPESGYREIIVHKYRVIYRVKQEEAEIEILAVHHGAKPLDFESE